MKRIYLVRHGQTVGNRDKFFQTSETELTDHGHAVAELVGRRLSNLDIDSLVASPMKRAQQTAEHISEHTNLDIETFDNFHEVMQAESTRGKFHDDEEVSFLTDFNNYFNLLSKDEPYEKGFEVFNNIIDRAVSCAEYLKGHDKDNIVVVSHASYINFFSAFLLMQEKKDKEAIMTLAGTLNMMQNAAVTEFTYEKNWWKLVTWNDMAHFAE